MDNKNLLLEAGPAQHLAIGAVRLYGLHCTLGSSFPAPQDAIGNEMASWQQNRLKSLVTSPSDSLPRSFTAPCSETI